MLQSLIHAVNIIHSTLREQIVKPATRSPKWSEARKKWLQSQPFCEVCKSTERLQVHHCLPFHDDPSKELDPSNFITLCMSIKECHLKIGHGDSFKTYNPTVKEDAAIVLADPSKYDEIVKKAIETRKINAPGQ